MSRHVVEVQDLSRRFRNTQALDRISLKIQPGYVYGLVGANGAGKTTLIKHLLGLLQAKEGSVRVFGKDPVQHPVQVLEQIGYLSEQRELPEWMRIDELMRYTAAFHPHWDEAYADELLKTFQLDVSKKIKHLSKGMRAQVGLVGAVAHRPELLLLDEPSTGLDAIVRRDILNAIIRTVADDGRTALFSSHLLDEVELMSDYVFIIDKGRLILEGELDEIKASHQLLVVTTSPDLDDSLTNLDGIISAERYGHSWKIISNGASQQVSESLLTMGANIVESRSASLQEIFVARVGRERLPEWKDETAPLSP